MLPAPPLRFNRSTATEDAMTPKENLTLAKNMYAMFNQRKLDEAAKTVANDCTWTNVSTGETFKGPSGFKEFAKGWITAFSDARVDIQNQFASENAVVTEFFGRGTHDGTLKTPAASIAPTRKKLDLKFCEVLTIKDGKVTGARLYFDTGTLMRQLGIVSESVGSK